MVKSGSYFFTDFVLVLGITIFVGFAGSFFTVDFITGFTDTKERAISKFDFFAAAFTGFATIFLAAGLATGFFATTFLAGLAAFFSPVFFAVTFTAFLETVFLTGLIEAGFLAVFFLAGFTVFFGTGLPAGRAGFFFVAIGLSFF
ncbi:MAG TPA: hypothetical protein VI548_13910 [Chitinophagaceae bacterium]|nr:hypothetical protein [Chitinophagaceae bacterium]